MDYTDDNEAYILKCLNNDDLLFEEEFESIKNTYPMKNHAEVYDFLKNNRGVIIILNKVKQLLNEKIPYSQLELMLENDPLFIPQLQLFVNVPKYDFENGFKENIRDINLAIRPTILKLDLSGEFFIFDGMIHDD